MDAPGDPPRDPRAELEADARREQLRLEGMRAALQRRPHLSREEEERQRRGGHAAKAGFRTLTAVVVVAGILATLYVLTLSSKALKLRDDARRPRVERAP